MKWKRENDVVTFIYDETAPYYESVYITNPKKYRGLMEYIELMLGNRTFMGTDEKQHNIGVDGLRFFEEYIPRVLGFTGKAIRVKKLKDVPG
jgi:hypothetical protein